MVPATSESQTCGPDEDPGAVEIAPTCTLPPADWTLRARWKLTVEEHTIMSVSTGRLGDTDGDGVVTASDDVAIWLTKVAFGDGAHAGARVDAQGTVLWEDDEWPEARLVGSTLGTTGPGEPLVRFTQIYTSGHRTYMTAASEGKTQYSANLGDRGFSYVLLADLEGDGVPEILTERFATDARTGALVYEFADGGLRPFAGDLDLDGTSDVLTTADGLPTLVHVETGAEVACPVVIEDDNSDSAGTAFAIGDLDGDPEGEFVVANAGIVAVCGADGALLAETTVAVGGTDAIGLAQLDDDALPEILLGQTLPDASATVVIALDTDLTPLWTTPVVTGGSHLPFAVADLDGDGRHEVIARRDTGVSILAPDGTILVELEIPSADFGAGYNPVVVTDIDGDGRAEILVGGMDPNLVVLENAAGGWPVRNAQDWWPGMDHFPGDRALDGSLPPGSSAHWLGEGTNVWQGLPAGAPDLPDLGVDAEACSEDCETTVILARVSNHGRADAPGPVSVELVRADGAVLASATVDAVPSGGGFPVDLRVPTSEAVGELVVRVRGPYVECLDVANEVVLAELPCR